MFALFVHGQDKLKQLLDSDPSWELRIEEQVPGIPTCIEFKYSRKDTTYFVELTGCEDDKSVMVDARLPWSAVTDLKIKLRDKTMEVVQADGTTLKWPLELVVTRSTAHIAIVTADPTDAATLDCILVAIVNAIKKGM
jgi:hypothetical protein